MITTATAPDFNLKTLRYSLNGQYIIPGTIQHVHLNFIVFHTYITIKKRIA